ncbi:hypothetical protein BpHYR1_006704 [Brachionus plicatilis]|uniref:Uncharacterized protein n=1 Tax=Brachionus plicatilis TaxID=10195 RepID=A0A3M7RR50_BRAPC|nr:hypothetical protein BpHYR1_006704 [Brachionus plicatilis]
MLGLGVISRPPIIISDVTGELLAVAGDAHEVVVKSVKHHLSDTLVAEHKAVRALHLFDQVAWIDEAKADVFHEAADDAYFSLVLVFADAHTLVQQCFGGVGRRQIVVHNPLPREHKQVDFAHSQLVVGQTLGHLVVGQVGRAHNVRVGVGRQLGVLVLVPVPVRVLLAIVGYEQVDLFERVLQPVHLGHLDEVAEIAAGEPLEQALFAVVEREQALEVAGARDRLEQVRVAVEGGARGVHDFD